MKCAPGRRTPKPRKLGSEFVSSEVPGLAGVEVRGLPRKGGGWRRCALGGLGPDRGEGALIGEKPLMADGACVGVLVEGPVVGGGARKDSRRLVLREVVVAIIAFLAALSFSRIRKLTPNAFRI